MKQRILVVDDEINIQELIRVNLEQAGFEVEIADNGIAALGKFEANKPDLIILDLMLPGKDGYDVCKAIRKTSNVPIIMLTAKETELERVLGLELGADDYIMKPYTVRNVIARVKSVLRRTSGPKSLLAKKPNILKVDGLQLDLEFKRCTVDGVEVNLTRKEFELLVYLISHRGKICSREQILSSVWSDEVVVLDRTIDVNITRVRSKIGPYGSYIVTRSGFGYGFRD